MGSRANWGQWGQGQRLDHCYTSVCSVGSRGQCLASKWPGVLKIRRAHGRWCTGRAQGARVACLLTISMHSPELCTLAAPDALAGLYRV